MSAFSDNPNNGELIATRRSSRLRLDSFSAVSESAPESPATDPGRGRLLFAGVLAAALLVALVIVVVLGDSEEEREFSAAPPQCIDDWNDDEAAIAFGRHQSGSHGYYEVQVLTLSSDGSAEVSPAAEGANCAVVFAATALDPEPVSAAQIQKRGAWIPLLQLAEPDRLADLQLEAQSAYNAQIGPDGRITAL